MQDNEDNETIFVRYYLKMVYRYITFILIFISPLKLNDALENAGLLDSPMD